MFARFKNLFSKNKSESEDANVDAAESLSTSGALFAESVRENPPLPSTAETTKLEGLNLLKSIVENEQNVLTKASGASTSLSEEMADLLKRRLSQKYESENIEVKNTQENSDSDQISFNHRNDEKSTDEEKDETLNSNLLQESDESLPISKGNENMSVSEESSIIAIKENENSKISASETNETESLNDLSNVNTSSHVDRKIMQSKDHNESDKITKETLENESNSNETNNEFEKHTENRLDLKQNQAYSLNLISEISKQTSNETLNENTTNILNPNEDSSKLSENNSINYETDNKLTSTNTYHENSPNLTDSFKSLSQSSINEKLNKSSIDTSTIPTADINTSPTNSSIVVEDIPSEINTPSPTVDSTISGSSSSNTSILDTAPVNEIIDPSKIIVNPIDNNGLACTSITNKLTDIAEVAESLDAVIREVQENVQSVELESNPSPSDKKMGTLRSTSSEDWHSRSTEDDSFATASEGNFTPHSHSSASFQTASGRTSSFISCDKNSFDAGEVDDSTFAFEMPELNSPLNMSFEGSEQSYLSAQPINGEDKEKTPTKLSESSSQTAKPLEEDQSSIADIEDLHSESITPTPAETIEEYEGESIPIESETELEIAGIADAPTMEILTEHSALPMSRTPEVSLNNTEASTNSNSNLLVNSNEARDSTDQETENANNNNKPNAAWRRSKYYENITKQTIKGFL